MSHPMAGDALAATFAALISTARAGHVGRVSVSAPDGSMFGFDLLPLP